MEIRTHRRIDHNWSGSPKRLDQGYALVELKTVPAMAADESGLVHGGFTFSAADHAAMLAVNDPLVVLGEASVKFLAPVWVGEVIEAEARIIDDQGRKVTVSVKVKTDRPVFEGLFTCFILKEPLLPGDQKQG